ncbi:hypothetical protein [Streptosporangium sp. 'caverna']|uniref:hypothetical protein n=1 Tax=Streptosporangium sp. 'caverna' TaxID=2202249 RepID=UPI0013A69BFA|nr:hypothetical protein [Streptosporangium sp. 'caverna']
MSLKSGDLGIAIADPSTAIRRALPHAIQVGDRWHLRHNFGQAVAKEVAAWRGLP